MQRMGAKLKGRSPCLLQTEAELSLLSADSLAGRAAAAHPATILEEPNGVGEGLLATSTSAPAAVSPQRLGRTLGGGARWERCCCCCALTLCPAGLCHLPSKKLALRIAGPVACAHTALLPPVCSAMLRKLQSSPGGPGGGRGHPGSGGGGEGDPTEDAVLRLSELLEAIVNLLAGKQHGPGRTKLAAVQLLSGACWHACGLGGEGTCPSKGQGQTPVPYTCRALPSCVCSHGSGGRCGGAQPHV